MRPPAQSQHVTLALLQKFLWFSVPFLCVKCFSLLLQVFGEILLAEVPVCMLMLC